MPKHPSREGYCPGGSFLPLEKDSSLAQYRLEQMKENHGHLQGSERASNSKRIKTLEERIERYRILGRPVGRWIVDTTYKTSHAVDIEQDAHRILSHSLDLGAPFGEVFSCSVLEARHAIEKALEARGLKDLAEKTTLTM